MAFEIQIIFFYNGFENISQLKCVDLNILQDENSDSDSSDDEDDTAELMAELARIKKERQQEIMEKVGLRSVIVGHFIFYFVGK